MDARGSVRGPAEPGTARGRRSGRPAARGTCLARLIGASALAASLSCYVAEPASFPHDPPPNVPTGITLLQLPDAVVESLASQRVEDDLATRLLETHLALERPTLTPQRREQILAHRVVTGMTVQEVILCFLADPSRERHQGPPGGRTLYWEPRDKTLDRYWVRFDGHGKAADAGRY